MNSWTIHRLVESAFPTGGFAHSAGLRAAQRLGQLGRPRDLAAFVEEVLWAAGSFGIPFVRAARADPRAHALLDCRCDAASAGAVANHASRSLGAVFLRAATRFSPDVVRLAGDVWRRELPGHLAPAFGAVLGLLGASDPETSRLFLYLGARGVVLSAASLRLVGPHEIHAVLARTAPVMTAVLAACSDAGPETAASTTSVPDLLRSHQERLRRRAAGVRPRRRPGESELRRPRVDGLASAPELAMVQASAGSTAAGLRQAATGA